MISWLSLIGTVRSVPLAGILGIPGVRLLSDGSWITACRSSTVPAGSLTPSVRTQLVMMQLAPTTTSSHSTDFVIKAVGWTEGRSPTKSWDLVSEPLSAWFVAR